MREFQRKSPGWFRSALPRDSGQSTYTAVVSVVILVGILVFAIGHIVLSVEQLLYDTRPLEETAILLSNDLLINPGYNSTSLDWNENPVHMGLAEYSSTKKSVEDHVLSLKKIKALERIGAEGLERYWGIKKVGVRIESLKGKKYLDIGQTNQSITITRLALIKKENDYEPVKLIFSLQT